MFGDGIQALSRSGDDAGAGYVCGHAGAYHLPVLRALPASARVQGDEMDCKTPEGPNIATVSAGPRCLLLSRLWEEGNGHNHSTNGMDAGTMRIKLLVR